MMIENVSESPIEQAFAAAWDFERIPLEPQYRISSYFVDFAHVPTKTAIELDGFATHSSADDIAKDRKRQREIELLGWQVIRFGGKEVLEDAHSCVREVVTLLSQRALYLGYDGIPEPEPAIPAPPVLPISPRLSASPLVGWSDFWGGWTVYRDETSDQVACSLWLAQLLCLAQEPVHAIWTRHAYDQWAEWSYEYHSPLCLTEDLTRSGYYQRAWCTTCRQWTKMLWEQGERAPRCFGCHPTVQRLQARELLDVSSSRWNRTLFALTMKLWEQRLSPWQRNEVSHYVGFIGSYRPLTYLCKLLAGIALIQLRPGEEIRTEKVGNHFWQLPWLREQVNRTQWDRCISTGITVWITHGWLEKQARGVYRRLATQEVSA